MSDDRTGINDYLKKVQHDSNKIDNLFLSARIYKVPGSLRKLNESAYVPRIIAIGPLHRNEKHLQTPMQGIKRHYINRLLGRLTKEGGIKSVLLKKCLDKMKEKTLVGEVKKFYAEEFTVNDDDLLYKTNKKEFVDKAKKYYTEEVAVNDAAKLNKTKEEFVDEAKKYYDKEVMMTVNDDDMSEMMLEDGCFILEVLCASHPKGNSKPVTGGEDGSSGNRKREKTDTILHIIWNHNFLKLDLLLLENQIPFFVLEELFKLTVAEIPENKLSLTDYVLEYFREIMSPEGKNSGSNPKTGCWPSDCALQVNRMASFCSPKEIEQGIEQVSRKDKKYYHILHLLHDSYQNSRGVPRTSPCRCPLLLPCCTPPKEKTTGKQFRELQISASDLDYAGVKFAVGPDGKSNQFNINFNEPQCIFSWLFCGAKFEIPTLDIHDPTESFFRNLIAFEQCCPGPWVDRYFTSYAKLMDMLISSKEDVKVLKEKGVIHNHLGTDEEVADLFNKLCKEVVLEKFYFNDQCQDAYKYSQYRWPWFWAQCKRRYFKSPWGFIGFIVAIIAFGITVTNFVRNFVA